MSKMTVAPQWSPLVQSLAPSLSRVLFSITCRLPRDTRMIPPESSRERLVTTAVLPLWREIMEARRSKTGSIKTRASDLDRETMTTIETTQGRHRHWRRDRQTVSSARLHLTRRARRRPQPPRNRPFAIVRTRLPHPSVSPAPPFSDNRTDDPECPNIARRRHRDRVSLSPSLSLFFLHSRGRGWSESCSARRATDGKERRGFAFTPLSSRDRSNATDAHAVGRYVTYL